MSPKWADKVTEMLLYHMENDQLLHLLDSDKDLLQKIMEAMRVLQEHGHDQQDETPCDGRAGRREPQYPPT